MTANYLMVAAPDPVAAEGTDGNTGAWRIMRTGIDVYPCVVDFRIDGPTDFTLQTAIGGDVALTTQTVDGVTYRTGTALMAPDESEVMLFLVPTNDAIKEETETVSIQITGYVSSQFSYSIGPLTPSITILDNDDWNVSVTATDAVAAEAPAAASNYGTYTIARSNETDTTHFLNVRFEMSGTASTSDYTLFTESGMVLTTQSMTFRPFNSDTCAFVGELQIAGNPTKDPGINDWVIEQLKNGYDVHVWDDGFDPSLDPDYVPDCAADGSGRAFDEIVNAVNNRGVTKVALIGYSHGGGSVYNLSYALSLMVWTGEGRNPYIPVFTSYIDAVQNNVSINPFSEYRRPINSLFHLNQYQPNFFTISNVTIMGGAIITVGDGTITTNIEYSDLGHLTIDDNDTVQTVLSETFDLHVQK